MRFACLLVEHLPTCVETLLEPSLAGKPIVVLCEWDRRVIDASPEAKTAGVAHGDTRQRVEQLCPQARILPAREALYQQQHEALRSILLNLANAVETSGLGELFVEIGALAQTFPSEHAFALPLLTQAHHATHLQPALGIASNRFTAMQAARLAVDEATRVLIVPGVCD